MNIALIPLRGGSKSIPRKNIKLLAGKPLCAWVIEAAHEAAIFDRICVSTDSEEIAAVVRILETPVEIIIRPAEYATDTASTESVMTHAASMMDFDIMTTIQATSPLTRPDDFRLAFEQFSEQQADSLLTCVRTKRFFWNEDGTAINYDPLHRPMRQQFRGTLMENGAFYFTRRNILESGHCRLGGKISVYEMPEYMALEIDEPEDWLRMEQMILERNDGFGDRE